MTKVKITSYVNEELSKRLKQVAEQEERSVTYLIEKALIEVYGKNKSN